MMAFIKEFIFFVILGMIAQYFLHSCQELIYTFI